MLGLLFNQVYRRLENRTVSPRPLFFLIDEAARLADRLDYENILSVVRSAGVGVVLAVQDISQFGDEREASGILANCLSLLALNETQPLTAEYVSRRVGNRRDATLSQAYSRRTFEIRNQKTVSHGIEEVPVLAPDVISHLRQGPYCAVVQVPIQTGVSKPFLVDLQR